MDFPQYNEEQFDLKNFIYQYLWRYWYLYVLFLGLCLFGAWLRIRYATPIYQVRGTLLIEDEQSKSAFVSEEAIFRDLGLMQGGPRVLNEIQVLQSRPLMTEVIKKLGMDTEYYIVGRVRTSENYPNSVLNATLREVSDKGYNIPFLFTVIDSQRFKLTLPLRTLEAEFGALVEIPEGRFTFTLIGPPQPDNTYKIIFRRPEQAADGYVSGLSINLINNYSSVVEMTYKSPVPQKAADILNTLVEVYNDATVDGKNQVGKNTIKFIDDRLKYLTTELSDVESNLEQYKRSNNIPTEISSSVDVLIEQLNESEQSRSELEIRKTLLSGLREYLENQLNTYEPAPVRLLPNDPQLSALVDRYNKLVLERERLLISAKPENPVVVNISKQIDVLRSTLLQTIEKSDNDLALQLSEAREAYEQFLKQIGSVPRKERGLIEIKRQQGIKETLFLYLLQKREETALSLAVAVPGSRVVDPAQPNHTPISPNRRSIYLMALFLGLLLPSGLVYLRTLLQSTLQSEQEIQQATKVPILGSIAFKKTADPAVVKPNSRSALSEMFRLMRTNLQFLNAGRPNQCILITSGISGEGKSFITLNLGLTMALAGKKTVVLELDLRKPKLIRYLSEEKSGSGGISTYLIGQGKKENLAIESALHPNLHYIPSGPIPPNPGELLLHQRIDELIAYLREHFDCILLDTPPVGMVADAFLLGRTADSALYIVRHNHTPKASLKQLETIREEEKLPHLALVYNGVKARSRYGYGNQYGYGYGYGYYEEEVKKKWWKWW
jgi:capsular exopolysaccharide synthesis family protein